MALNKHWFTPRKFLWGWTPVTWEGWMVALLALLAVYLSATQLSGTMRYVSLGATLIALMLVSELKSNPRLILKHPSG